MAKAAAEWLPEKIWHRTALQPLSHAMYRDATVRCQIWRVRFAVGGYAVFGVLGLLAQVVQLPQLQKHAAENWAKRKSKTKHRGCLVNQVDSAGNTTGSDQPFGWREEIDCADKTRKGGHL
jgi:hypothetical protein